MSTNPVQPSIPEPVCPCGKSHATDASNQNWAVEAACGCDHSHGRFSVVVAFCGLALVLNSYILGYLLPGQSFASQLSALAGACVLAVPILRDAAADLLRAKLRLNALVALAVLAALAGSDFQTAGVIAFFLYVSVIIESGTAIGAQRSLHELMRLAPKMARRIADGVESEVPAVALKPGDVIVVRPGENFPADGAVQTGKSAVNQSSVTGESVPADKVEGSEVYAGTENLSGVLQILVTKVGLDTTIGKVREIIMTAQRTETPITRAIDQYMAYYIPVVLMIAGLVWLLSHSADRVVALLVISCPCVLILATPSAIVAAVSAAARFGALVKRGEAMEVAARISSMVMDKTGTLTEGRLSVASIDTTTSIMKSQLLGVAASIERNSNHPIAKAVHALAVSAGVPMLDISNFSEYHGEGVEGCIDGRNYQVGRRSWIESTKQDTDFSALPPEPSGGRPMSFVYVCADGCAMGRIGLLDGARKEAKTAVEMLLEMGVDDIRMVTGDRAAVAESVANELGIKKFTADCLPDAKVAEVKEAKAATGFTAVAGDGINDAPALAAGDLGIAFGLSASDLAVSSAPVAIVSNDLRCIPMLLGLARKTKTIINMNLALGTIVILTGISLSVFGFLPQIAAATLHAASTLLVVFNSGSLIRFGEDFKPGA